MSIRNWLYREETHPEHYYVFLTVCPMCSAEREIFLEAAHMKDYLDGALIQNAFPNLDADEREALQTGICSACWDKMG